MTILVGRKGTTMLNIRALIDSSPPMAVERFLRLELTDSHCAASLLSISSRMPPLHSVEYKLLLWFIY